MKPFDPPSSERSPTRRRAKTKPALLEAGLKLLAERPVDSLSIDEIVAAAGVAKGSFFYHFTDKQSFAREIAASVRAEIESTIALVNLGIEDPARRVARGIGQFVNFALRSPDKAAMIITADWRSVDPAYSLNAGLRADIDLGLSAGRFDCPQRDAAMLNLIGVTNLLISKVLFEHLSVADTRSLFRSTLAFAFRGLGLAVAEAEALLDVEAGEILRG